MIIQKGTVKAIFHERGLSLKPEVLPEIDRQITEILEQCAVKKATLRIKRLNASDILLFKAPEAPIESVTDPEAGKGADIALKPRIEDNPSKIRGPCSRCVGIHDRVIRIARDLETQINEGAKSVYEEKLRNFRG